MATIIHNYNYSHQLAIDQPVTKLPPKEEEDHDEQHARSKMSLQAQASQQKKEKMKEKESSTYYHKEPCALQ